MASVMSCSGPKLIYLITLTVRRGGIGRGQRFTGSDIDVAFNCENTGNTLLKAVYTRAVLLFRITSVTRPLKHL